MRPFFIFVLGAITASVLLSQKQTLVKAIRTDSPEVAQLRSTLEGLYADLAELKALHAREAAIERTLDQRLLQTRTPPPPKYLH